jgi:hypothetical protein
MRASFLRRLLTEGDKKIDQTTLSLCALRSQSSWRWAVYLKQHLKAIFLDIFIKKIVKNQPVQPFVQLVAAKF